MLKKDWMINSVPRASGDNLNPRPFSVCWITGLTRLGSVSDHEKSDMFDHSLRFSRPFYTRSDSRAATSGHFHLCVRSQQCSHDLFQNLTNAWGPSSSFSLEYASFLRSIHHAAVALTLTAIVIAPLQPPRPFWALCFPCHAYAAALARRARTHRQVC